jgi:nitrate reductase NapE component
MNIDWTKFEQVALGAIGFSAFVVIVYSLGVRFLTTAQHLAGKGNKAASSRELALRVLSYALFAVAAVAVAWAVIWMFQVMYTPAK